MIIQKDYKFYAAHRNEELDDKCRNLHGHRYGVRCFFEVERAGAISTLFGEYDQRIEPFLKAEYDHSMLIHIADPLYETLYGHAERTGEALKMKLFDAPTSVENLAYQLFSEITELGLPLGWIGRAMHSVMVRRDLKTIFDYREQTVNQLLESAPSTIAFQSASQTDGLIGDRRPEMSALQSAVAIRWLANPNSSTQE